MEHLNSRDLVSCFDAANFNHVYRKRNGDQANAYTLGLTIADYLILNAKPQSHDTRNEE
jgi:hypothetical protein